MPLGKRLAQPDQSGPRPQNRPSKKRRVDAGAIELDRRRNLSSQRPRRDQLSQLSDELLIRILSFLPLPNLVGVSPVSRRFHRLSSDSQLWRQLYYLRFVLPRALRIPGFQPSPSQATGVCTRTVLRHSGVDFRKSRARGEPVDWKRQYKLRHNWARGKCAVEELDVGSHGRIKSCRDTLVKVADGIAVTADSASGLRVWDLKTKRLLAETSPAGVGAGAEADADATPGAAPAAVPTCVAVDDERLVDGHLGIALGFTDGSFTTWSFTVHGSTLALRYSHPRPPQATPATPAVSAHEALIQVAYSFPYLMTASKGVVVSLYSFQVDVDACTTSGNSAGQERELDRCISDSEGGSGGSGGSGSETLLEPPSDMEEMVQGVAASSHDGDNSGSRNNKNGGSSSIIAPPYLITSLKSHSSQAPLALSIRRLAASVIASIAFTLPTRDGWTIGVQDLHMRCGGSRPKPTPEIFNSRLAHATPVTTSGPRPRPRARASHDGGGQEPTLGTGRDEAPTALCYTHPYLLATLPDNTLILYLCTSNANALSISPGIRLWGHTSGIADAEITSRGKAVSVSYRGDEVRVWELEGRSGGRSVEIRPSLGTVVTGLGSSGSGLGKRRMVPEEWDHKRNWVGFDDEMVIVLKESRCGKESLVVYDFT